MSFTVYFNNSVGRSLQELAEPLLSLYRGRVLPSLVIT